MKTHASIIAVAGLLFLFTLVFGLSLSRNLRHNDPRASGKPLAGALPAMHKLAALATVIIVAETQSCNTLTTSLKALRLSGWWMRFRMRVSLHSLGEIPVGLMVTWGAGHFFSKDLRTAIYVAFISCVIGLLHFANRKDIWPSLIFWLVMTGG
jgi:hypothetical protein